MKKYSIGELNDEVYRLKYLLKNYKMTSDERDYISIMLIKIIKQIDEAQSRGKHV